MIRPGLMEIAFRPCLRADLDEILVALIIFCQKDQMSQLLLLALGPLETAPPGHIDLAAQDGLDPLGHTFFIEIHSAIHDAVVRDGQRRLPHVLHMGHQLLDAASAVEETVLCMHMQMDKWVHGGIHGFHFLSLL